jgi:hypothetical protein
MSNRRWFTHAQDEVLVRKTLLLSLAMVLVLVTFAACPRHRGGDPAESQKMKVEKIAPASAPTAPTGTDAMTQTVDVEDSRSEAEGGAVTEQTAKPAHQKAPAKKGKKH